MNHKGQVMRINSDNISEISEFSCILEIKHSNHSFELGILHDFFTLTPNSF
jgi:hypothetical protein